MARLQPSKVELWGATLAGRHSEDLWARLIGDQGQSSEAYFTIFNFTGINSVSPSYLKRFLIPVFNGEFGNLQGVEIFPVVTALTTDVREDLGSFLNERGLVLREIETDADSAKHIRFVGDLERVARQTLEALDDFEEASAVDLHSKYDGLGIAQTAWNNRLANLHRMRLATRRKEGRSLIYQSAIKSKSWAKA